MSKNQVDEASSLEVNDTERRLPGVGSERGHDPKEVPVNEPGVRVSSRRCTLSCCRYRNAAICALLQRRVHRRMTIVMTGERGYYPCDAHHLLKTPERGLDGSRGCGYRRRNVRSDRWLCWCSRGPGIAQYVRMATRAESEPGAGGDGVAVAAPVAEAPFRRATDFLSDLDA